MVRLSICFVICLLLLPIYAAGQGLLNEPEGLAFDSVNNRFLVSCWGGRQIVAFDESGNMTPFKTSLGNCAGMHIIGNTVYVCISNNRVEGFDLTTAERVFLCSITTAGCHDITSDPSGFLYATDWNGHRVFKVNPADSTWSVFVSTGLLMPGGIHYDETNDRLIIMSMNESTPIKGINVADSAVSDIIDPDLPGLDGIAFGPEGYYYVTTLIGNGLAPNAVYMYDTDFANEPVLIAEGMNGLVDACYSPQWNVLAVTAYLDGTVDFLPVISVLDVKSYNLLDDVSGDGDGIPEAGETIDVVITVGNSGPFSADDLALTFTCEDLRLTISDGSLAAATLAPGDSTDNADQPFRVAIPADYAARIDSFFIEAIWTENGDPRADVISFTAAIGRPSILLIDDDNDDTLEQFYLESFEAFQVPVDIWSMPPASGGVDPDSSDLNPYDIVLWSTGDYRLPFDGVDVAAMQGYLDGGGNLFLTGQGIADMLDMGYSDFLHNYLRCNFLSSGYTPILAATGNGVICQAGDSIVVFGTPGANNQTLPGHIEAINGSLDEFAYTGPTDLGAVSYTGDYRLVFFAFGFEAIQNDNDRWVDRPTMLQAILDFFDYTWPAAPPVTTSPDLFPGDVMFLTEHTPDILWTYTDPADRPQEMYRIQVGVDDDWSASEMWDSGPVAGASSQGAYDGTPLQDGSVYYLRIRTSNGILWSPWTERQFRMNSVPTPTGLVPDDSTETDVSSPLLSHDTMTDAESTP